MQDRKMKRRRMTAMIGTAASAAAITAAGVLLLPVAYGGIFDAGKAVFEEEALPEELLAAPGLFMDGFRYPLGEETESISSETETADVEYFRSVAESEIYEKAFELVGLTEEEDYWEHLAAVKGEEFFLIRTQAEKDGENQILSVALNRELIPFLICRESGREPSEEEVREAAGTLWELCGTGAEELRLYVEEIDGIYETCQEYRKAVADLYLSLVQEEQEAPVQEIGEEVPLWDCCARGEWQVCADDREAMLVCIMGQGDMVLYYDAAEREFCGYRLRLGEVR